MKALLFYVVILCTVQNSLAKPPHKQDQPMYVTWEDKGVYTSSALTDECLQPSNIETKGGVVVAKCDNTVTATLLHHFIFDNKDKAIFYSQYCKVPNCLNWNMRIASPKEVQAHTLAYQQQCVASSSRTFNCNIWGPPAINTWSEMWTKPGICPEPEQVTVVFDDKKTEIWCADGKDVEKLYKPNWWKDDNGVTYVLAKEDECTNLNISSMLQVGAIYCSGRETLEFDKPHQKMSKPWFLTVLEQERENERNSKFKINVQ